MVPVNYTLLPYIEEADQHDADVDQHFQKTEETRTVFRGIAELAVDDRPGVEENSLYVEQNKEHSDQVESNREAALGVTRGRDATLIGLVFLAAGATLTEQGGKHYHAAGNAQRDHQVNQNRQISGEIIVRHKNRFCIMRANQHPANF